MPEPNHNHSRRSNRLKGFDYSLPGAYFVTLVTFSRACLFGKVSGEDLELNLLGQCAATILQTLPFHFNIDLDEWVVMPNHVHAIFFIQSRGDASGRMIDCGEPRLSPDASPLPGRTYPHGTVPSCLGAIIQNFKSITARKINAIRNTPDSVVWQRNYYDRIIRDDRELERVRGYILDNPRQWMEDLEYME
ncbi:MAG: transposase [Bellilinea sp.]